MLVSTLKAELFTNLNLYRPAESSGITVPQQENPRSLGEAELYLQFKDSLGDAGCLLT